MGTAAYLSDQKPPLLERHRAKIAPTSAKFPGGGLFGGGPKSEERITKFPTRFLEQIHADESYSNPRQSAFIRG